MRVLHRTLGLRASEHRRAVVLAEHRGAPPGRRRLHGGSRVQERDREVSRNQLNVQGSSTEGKPFPNSLPRANCAAAIAMLASRGL